MLLISFLPGCVSTLEFFLVLQTLPFSQTASSRIQLQGQSRCSLWVSTELGNDCTGNFLWLTVLIRKLLKGRISFPSFHNIFCPKGEQLVMAFPVSKISVWPVSNYKYLSNKAVLQGIGRDVVLNLRIVNDIVRNKSFVWIVTMHWCRRAAEMQELPGASLPMSILFWLPDAKATRHQCCFQTLFSQPETWGTSSSFATNCDYSKYINTPDSPFSNINK